MLLISVHVVVRWERHCSVCVLLLCVNVVVGVVVGFAVSCLVSFVVVVVVGC